MASIWRAIVAFLRNIWQRIFGRKRNPVTLSAKISTKPPGPPPGVGICLSGGGSRALTAGLGQLRGLAHLQKDGAPLLSQVTAMSTVSGGSWLGVPWMYLNGDTTDTDYLGAYVGDPSRLVLSATTGHSDAETLDYLPAGSPGRNIGSHFTVEDMVLQALWMRLRHGTPWNMMWQILTARHLLHPYGLYRSGRNGEPTSLFSLDTESLERDVVGPNPKLKHETAHLVATAAHAGRMSRPFMICNTSMFVRDGDEQYEYLAPVQATPLFTGILGAPAGVDANGQQVGGGGVNSFAFSSDLTAAHGDDVTVSQLRQLSLTDIVGASSAAFAETLQNFLAEAKKDSGKLHEALAVRKSELSRSASARAQKHPGIVEAIEDLTVEIVEEMLRDLDPTELIPRYDYWPVRDIAVEPTVEPTRFADGGSLENTGIAGMLAHEQIHSIMAFVNPDAPMRVENGLLIVSDQVPVLFGFQPYDKHNPATGYVPFDSADVASLGSSRIFRYNQVFESKGFAELLRGWTEASGDNVDTQPAIFRQTLVTVDNEWFGIKGGRSVEVVWYHLNDVTNFTNQLSEQVQHKVKSWSDFPNYSTFATQLDATRFNLMSALTAWSVADGGKQQLYRDLF